MSTYEELKKEAEEKRVELLKTKSDFFKKYSELAEHFNNVIIPEMEKILEWIVENKEQRNFIVAGGVLGKKAHQEFLEKVSQFETINSSIHYRIESYYIRLKTSFFVNSGNTSKYFEIDVTKYNNDEKIYKTDLSIVTSDDVQTKIDRINALDSEIDKLISKRNNEVNEGNFETLLNVFGNVKKRN